MWQLALLLPQPPLSLAYLLAVRGNRVEPAFLPLLVLGAFPLAALAIGVRALAARSDGERGTAWLLIAAAVLELAWATLSLAIVGMAIGLRSG